MGCRPPAEVLRGRCSTVRENRGITVRENGPGGPIPPRQSEEAGSERVENIQHAVTMRAPHPVALQPGGIPCPSSGRTPRRSAGSSLAEPVRGPEPLPEDQKAPRGTNPAREGT